MTTTHTEHVTIKFEGLSDDTAGCYWDSGDVDDDDCAAGTLRVFHVRTSAHRMAVSMVYGAGTWLVGVGPVCEGDELPPWPTRWMFDGYTAVLEIDVPNGAEVALVSRFHVGDKLVALELEDEIEWFRCTGMNRAPEYADVLAVMRCAKETNFGGVLVIPSSSPVTVKECEASARRFEVSGVRFAKEILSDTCLACHRQLSADDDGDAEICLHSDCGTPDKVARSDGCVTTPTVPEHVTNRRQ